MNSRERLLTALNHEEPDRVPIDLWFTGEIEALLSPLYGGLRGVELRVALGHDLVMSSSPNIGASYEIPGTPEEYTCEWGVRWKWVTNAEGGRYTETVGHPLAEAVDLTSYTMPDPLGASMQPIYAETRQLVEKYGKTHVVFGSLYQTVFEAAWLLRGMQVLLSDMLINKDFAHELFERLTVYSLVAGKEMVAQDIDVLWLGDDFGTQRAMLLSPHTWREFIKERYARLIAAYKAQNPSLKVAYHCDGYIEPIIPDLIEIGLDILNPIQPLSMDPAEIKRKFGQHLSFWGTVDVQNTFPFGTVQDVANEVRERIRTVAPGGGLILCSAHRVQPGTPLENVLAYYRAASEFGKYPVRVYEAI
jgi:uroporphyrinogen decarboxylase